MHVRCTFSKTKQKQIGFTTQKIGDKTFRKKADLSINMRMHLRSLCLTSGSELMENKRKLKTEYTSGFVCLSQPGTQLRFISNIAA